MQPSETFELTTDGRQQEKPKAGCGGPRAELIRRKFFPWMTCALLIVSILMSAVTLGIVAKLKNPELTNSSLAELRSDDSRLRKTNSEMMNSSLAKLQSDVSRLIEIIENSEMINSSLAKLQSDVFRMIDSIKPVQALNTWRCFKENEYYFTSYQCLWTEAEQLCTSRKAKLVVINSQEEQDYIRLNVNCERWIGLHDRAKEGTWRWVDGTDYAKNVKFWASGQPNGTGGLDEDCAVVRGDGFWFARPCNTTYSVICERPMD